MAGSSEQVKSGMGNVESVTTDNAAAAEEESASAEEMSAQVTEVTASSQPLSDLVGDLKPAVSRFKFVSPTFRLATRDELKGPDLETMFSGSGLLV